MVGGGTGKSDELRKSVLCHRRDTGRSSDYFRTQVQSMNQWRKATILDPWFEKGRIPIMPGKKASSFSRKNDSLKELRNWRRRRVFEKRGKTSRRLWPKGARMGPERGLWGPNLARKLPRSLLNHYEGKRNWAQRS